MDVIIDSYDTAPNLWAVYISNDNSNSNYRTAIYVNIYKWECEAYAKEHGYNIINKSK